jgi:hypothetical protein
MSHIHGCCLYSSTNLHVISSFHLAGIFISQIALRQSQQIIHTLLNCAVMAAVGVYARQVNGGGRLLASKFELFYTLALPASLPGKLPFLEFQESKRPHAAINLQQVTCSLALPLSRPRVNRPLTRSVWTEYIYSVASPATSPAPFKYLFNNYFIHAA